MSDRVLVSSGDWAVATDGVQWILSKVRKGGSAPWYGVFFVRSTKDVLARCMCGKGCSPADAKVMLAALRASFDDWLSSGLALPETGLPNRPADPVPAWLVAPGAGVPGSNQRAGSRW